MDESSDETLELGGSIALTGFKDIDGASMVIIKKIVGNYARKISDNTTGFEKLKLNLKTVHRTEKSEKYEIHAQVIEQGNSHNAEIVDRNLYFAIDNVLKKILNEMGLV